MFDYPKRFTNVISGGLGTASRKPILLNQLHRRHSEKTVNFEFLFILILIFT